MNTGSNAGPFKVSPTRPKVVTPTLWAINDKSVSDVYTPGDTNTFWFACAAIIKLFCYRFILLINIRVFMKKLYF